MFEQSVVEARALTARPWTLAVSVMGQAVLVTAAVVIPMLHPETLRKVVMLVPTGGPPTAYRRAEPVKAEPGREAVVNRSRHAFVAPASIPDSIAIGKDSLPDVGGSISGIGPESGVPGGLPIEGALGLGPSTVAPPPMPAPVKVPERPVVKQAPPPVPPTPTQIRRGGEVQASLLVFKPQPIYPPLAKQAHISGVVKLAAVIGTDGKIANLRVMSGHPLLVQSAMDAVKRWVYSPTLLNGAPVEVLTDITVTFTLN